MKLKTYLFNQCTQKRAKWAAQTSKGQPKLDEYFQDMSEENDWLSMDICLDGIELHRTGSSLRDVQGLQPNIGLFYHKSHSNFRKMSSDGTVDGAVLLDGNSMRLLPSLDFRNLRMRRNQNMTKKS